MSARIKRMLQLWRIVAACLMLSTGIPVSAAEPQRIALVQLERGAAVKVQHAGTRPTHHISEQKKAQPHQAFNPVGVGAYSDHLHLEKCVLLC